ncbi:alkaline phosphatase [Fusobacterium sp. SYSU M8D902]|uniref:alkaline phosphatase n=1 Tax=Fusobacterium sp. SYSU M8D902 TaxID=3159562 RepID=UPI0032E3E6BD
MLSRKKIMFLGMTMMAVTSFAQAKYVFYFIGDGMGAGQRQITEEFKKQVLKKDEKLLMNSLPTVGITTTYSANTLITDSAAAGTALATGHKTNNGYIAKDKDGKDLKTLLEIAQEKGMATGLVTTTRITHATPAVFASHNIDRDDENGIAVDYVDSGVDYLAGGGYRHFVGKNSGLTSKRKDDRDLIGEFKERGYQVYLGEKSIKDFEKWNPKEGEKVLATFKASHMPYTIDDKNGEYPTLKEMTDKGIELLSKDKDGFFIMVEGGRIDHASHAQDVAGTIYDTLAFDDAIKSAYEFYKKYPQDTLIVVAADHETGGMGLGFGNNYYMKLDELKNVKVSIEDTLQGIYKGDKTEYFNYIEKNLGLKNLTDKEKESILKAMKIEDEKEEVGDTFGGYSPTAIAVAHIISERSGMQWTTFAHTGVQVPLAVVGEGAEKFTGFKDNTDVARSIANSMGKEIK